MPSFSSGGGGGGGGGGGHSPITNTFIAPAVSYDSKFWGKFMPVLFCIIELVYFDAPKIIFLFTHLDDIHTFQPLM